MKKEYKVASGWRTHSLSHDSRRGAVSIVHDGKIYDNVHNPIAYAKRIFAVNKDANVYVRFGPDQQYPIHNGEQIKIEFPWS